MSSAATPFPEIVRKTVGWSIALSVLLILAGFFALFAGSLVYLDIAFSGEVRSVLYIAQCHILLK